MKKILFTFFLLFFLTGCWNYQELNKYAIVTGMAIDEKDGKYEVSLLFANGKKENEEKNQIKIYSNYGETIFEAIEKIGLTIPKELYISHLSLVIISEDIAKKGVTPVLDYLLRAPQSHQNFNIVVSKENKAKDILSIINPLADYPSQNIAENIKINEKKQGRITYSSFNKFVSNILKKGINPVINSIRIVGDKDDGTKKEIQENSKSNTYTILDTVGIFKDDKLIEWASVDESIGINMLLGNVEKMYIEIPCNKENIVISVNNLKVKNKVNKDEINVTIESDATINEIGCNLNLENIDNLKTIEDKGIKKMEEYANKALMKSKLLNTDIFGYGEMIYKKYPRYFNSISTWDEKYNLLNIDIQIYLNLENKGALEQTIGALADE